MHLTEATWTDADALDTELAVLPVGSTEQHGPHAPLGTDALAAEAIATEGVERVDREVVVAPPVQVGAAAEHRQFPGTLWVSPDIFRAYVRETVESLAHHGWNRVVVVNGHGGNVAPLREVCARVSRDGTAYAVPFTWFDAIETGEGDGDGFMGHGGPVETSLVQLLRPDLVDEERFAAAAAGAADGWGEWHDGVNLAYDSAEFSDSGVVGDPGEGSADLGQRLYDRASDQLAALLDTIGTRDLSRPATPGE